MQHNFRNHHVGVMRVGSHAGGIWGHYWLQFESFTAVDSEIYENSSFLRSSKSRKVELKSKWTMVKWLQFLPTGVGTRLTHNLLHFGLCVLGSIAWHLGIGVSICCTSIKMIPCSIQLFCLDLISAILAFLYHDLHISYRFFCYGSKTTNMIFCTGMYTIPTWKQAKSRKQLVIKCRRRPL